MSVHISRVNNTNSAAKAPKLHSHYYPEGKAPRRRQRRQRTDYVYPKRIASYQSTAEGANYMWDKRVVVHKLLPTLKTNVMVRGKKFNKHFF